MIGILEQMNTIAWAEYDMRKGGGARCYYCFRSSLGWKFTYDEKTGDVTEIPSATKLLKRKVPQSPVKDDVHGELLAGRSQESGSMAGQAPYGILNTNEQSQDSDELDRLDQKAPSVSETPFSNISNIVQSKPNHAEVQQKPTSVKSKPSKSSSAKGKKKVGGPRRITRV